MGSTKVKMVPVLCVHYSSISLSIRTPPIMRTASDRGLNPAPCSGFNHSLLLLPPKHFLQNDAAPSFSPLYTSSCSSFTGCRRLFVVRLKTWRWSKAHTPVPQGQGYMHWLSFPWSFFHMATTLLPAGSQKVEWPSLSGLKSRVTPRRRPSFTENSCFQASPYPHWIFFLVQITAFI